MLTGKRLNIFFTKSGNEARILTIMSQVNIVLESLASTIRWEKEIRPTNKERRNKTLFADEMITYVGCTQKNS